MKTNTLRNRLTTWISNFHPQLTAVLALGLVLAGATQASASIIASDNFDSYDGVNSIVGQSGASNNWANGWSTPAAPSGTATSLGANPIQFTPAGGALLGGGNYVEVAGSGTLLPAKRQLLNPITGTFYIGFLIKFTGTLNTSDLYTLGFSDRPDNTANGFNMGFNGVATGSASYYFARKGTGTPSLLGPVLTSVGTATSTNYLVFKVEKVGGTNYNRITGWVNPSANAEATNANGTIIAGGTWQLSLDSGISSVSDFYFRASGADAGDSTRFDALALATTFADLMAAAGNGPANPAPVDTLRVETLANGSGVVVPTQTINSGSSITNFAIARDGGGAFIANATATQWYLQNITGSVLATDLKRSDDAKSAVFKGAGLGTAEIVAIADATNIVFSGTITVQLAVASQVRVETQPDGSGTVVGAQNLTAGTPITVYAVSRDAGGNFIANVAATWSLENITGGIVSGDLVPAAGNSNAVFTAGTLPGTANIRATSGILTSVDSGLIRVTRALTWSGTSATWDAASVNWLLPDLVTLTNFTAGDDLTFNDTGAANPIVNLVGSLSSRTVTVGGSTPYTFSGAGSISGATPLTVSAGAGTLTVLNTNDYTGLTTFGSSVALGDGGSSGSLGTNDIRFNAATISLTYNRTNAYTHPSRIYNLSGGGGTLVVNAGSFTTAGSQDNTGVNVTVKTNGTFVMGKTWVGAVAVVAVGGNLVIEPGGTAIVAGSGKNQIAGSAQYIVDGLLDLRGFDFDTSRMASGLGTIDSTVFGASGCVLNVGNSGILSTFSGQIKDSGWDATHKLSLTKGGSVDFQLGGTNSYHGDTTVGQAVLRLTSDAAIPHGVGFGNLSLSGGTLDLNGNNIILNGLNGSSALNDSVNTATNLTVGDADAGGNHTGGMTGAFGVTKIGSGVQSFGGTKGYTGATVVSNGTLRINGTLSASPVTVIAGATLGGTGVISSNAVVSGTLSPGTTGIGNFEVTLGTTFQPGSTLFMELNKASATTNDALIGPVSAGGNLVVTNIGAALLVGDRFQLFSVAPTGAFASTVLPTGYTWSNSIATDGAIQVLTVPSSVPTTPTNLTFTASGGSLTLSWPANYLGWSLQAQTNGLSAGLNTNWVTIPGSATNTTMVIPMNPANGAVFYRMFYQP